MNLQTSWNAKTIQDHLENSRMRYEQLYKGEKYLISKFIKNNDSILDIGCGQGGFFNILKKKYNNINYTGIDFNKKMIHLAKKNFPSGEFYHFTKKNYLRFFKKKFNVVIIFGILHLNRDWKKILLNASKIVSRAILFDHRIVFKKKSKKNYFINLDFIKKKKNYRIDYFLLKKNELENFLDTRMKNFSYENYSYQGYASKFSNIKDKITFSNMVLKK